MTPTHLALSLGMSLFFGLAFEGLYGGIITDRPGGIRTFPLFALLGTALWSLNSGGLPFSAGLLVIGAWQWSYAQSVSRAGSGKQLEEGRFVIPCCNLFAYCIGMLSVAQPPWVVIAMTVAATLLMMSRTSLRKLARVVPHEEILTVGQFLLLIGVLLPLLPNTDLIGFGALTPHRLALTVVTISSLSYGGYLLQRYLRPPGATLLAGLLGGLYSSTATTVALARAHRRLAASRSLNAAILLATAVMYVRLFAILTMFNPPLGLHLLCPLAMFCMLTILFAACVSFAGGSANGTADGTPPLGNPLNLLAALGFAVLLAVVTVFSNFVKARYGHQGIDVLATTVGVVDIDPFILGVAQGGIKNMSLGDTSRAVLLAVSSNNAMKAIYTVIFGGARRMALAAVPLLLLSAMGITLAFQPRLVSDALHLRFLKNAICFQAVPARHSRVHRRNGRPPRAF